MLASASHSSSSIYLSIARSFTHAWRLGVLSTLQNHRLKGSSCVFFEMNVERENSPSPPQVNPRHVHKIPLQSPWWNSYQSGSVISLRHNLLHVRRGSRHLNVKAIPVGPAPSPQGVSVDSEGGEERRRGGRCVRLWNNVPHTLTEGISSSVFP